MEQRFRAGENTVIVVDETERKRWADLGVTDRAAQDAIFRQMAYAVEALTENDSTEWESASDLLSTSREPHSTDR